MTFGMMVAAALVSAAWGFGVWWVTNRVIARQTDISAEAANLDIAMPARPRWLPIAAAVLFGCAVFATIWTFVAAHPDLVAVATVPEIASPDRVETAATAPTEPHSSKPSSGDLNVLLKRLEDRMAKEPDDAEGWALLARSYMELKRYPDAARTYAKATSKLPNEVGLWIEFVDAEVMAHERKWTPLATSAIAKALTLSPENPKALWLAGTERFESKDYKGAVRFWEMLARIATSDSEYANEIRPALLEAKALAEGRDPRVALQEANISVASVLELAAKVPLTGLKQTDDKSALFSALQQELGDKAGVAVGASSEPRVTGSIEIDPALKALVKTGDTLFVFARAESKITNGKPNSAVSNTPVAVAKYPATDWPVAFSLTNQNSMSPEASLSTAQQVTIVARISHSGDAKASPNDLEGVSEPISVAKAATANVVVIKRRLP